MIRLLLPKDREIRSIADIPGLEGIRKISSQLSVNFTLYGSVLRHLLTRIARDRAGRISRDVLRQLKGPSQREVVRVSAGVIDLFAITPFTTDIDIVHTGPSSLTPRIFQQILDEVPNAECFRWEIRAEVDYQPFRDAKRFSSIIPANQMYLSDSVPQGIIDPWFGAGDIFSQKYRFIRNGFYKDSPLYADYRDLEIFSVLLYFRILLQDGVNWTEQPGFADAKATIEDAMTDVEGFIRIEDSSFIRAKLSHYFLNLRASAKNTESFRNLVDESGLTRYVSRIQHPVRTIRRAISTSDKHGNALVASSWLRGDRFRLPATTRFLARQEVVASAFQSAGSSKGVKPAPTPKLAENQTLLFASETLGVTLGGAIAIGSEIIEEGAERVHEFIHFAIRLDSEMEQVVSEYQDEDMAAIVSIEATQSKSRQSLFLASPNAIQLRRDHADGEHAMYVRVNLSSCLNELSTLVAKENQPIRVNVRTFIVGWKFSPAMPTSISLAPSE